MTHDDSDRQERKISSKKEYLALLHKYFGFNMINFPYIKMREKGNMNS